jgi:hypothetical protein
MRESRTHLVQVYVTAEEWDLVLSLAKLRALTASDFLREALHLPPLDQALHVHIARAPTPLVDVSATAPDYREGYDGRRSESCVVPRTSQPVIELSEQERGELERPSR